MSASEVGAEAGNSMENGEVAGLVERPQGSVSILSIFLGSGGH